MNTDTIKKKDLKFCMQLSQKAYDKKYGISDIDQKITDLKKYYEYNPEFFTCLDKKGNFYIVFKGSDGFFKDWIDNLKFMFKKEMEYKFHGGHLEQWKQVETKIYTELVRIKSDIKNIIFTGHSLGGSLAEIGGMLTGRKLAFLKDRIKIYSYGANRNMNLTAKLWLDKNIWCARVVNDNDIVPKAPLKMFSWIKKLNFCHPATKIKLKKKRSFWQKIFFLKIKEGIKDHYPQKYLNNIDNLYL